MIHLPGGGTVTLSEEDKLTKCLFGEYYSHAASILDLKGQAVIYFVFSVSGRACFPWCVTSNHCFSFLLILAYSFSLSTSYSSLFLDPENPSIAPARSFSGGGGGVDTGLP